MRQHPLAHNQQRIALARTLKAARVRCGLKQMDIADRLAVRQSFVSKYESGQQRLDLIELIAICGALGIAVRDLLAAFEDELSRGVTIEAGCEVWEEK